MFVATGSHTAPGAGLVEASNTYAPPGAPVPPNGNAPPAYCGGTNIGRGAGAIRTNCGGLPSSLLEKLCNELSAVSTAKLHLPFYPEVQSRPDASRERRNWPTVGSTQFFLRWWPYFLAPKQTSLASVVAR